MNTKKSGHTPGPWYNVPYHRSHWIQAGEDLRVAQIPTLHPHGKREREDMEIELANAALIAAAPDLYKKAIAVIKAYQGGESESAVKIAVAQLKTAVIKAKGE